VSDTGSRAQWTGAAFKEFLGALREVGWSEWDPIGLLSDRPHCEDEYDTYLLAAAGKLVNGADEEKVIDYLVYVETSYMGLTGGQLVRERASRTVRRIAELPGGPQAAGWV
jgi:hypothetical protein